ncbi:Calcium-binding mitochondrial carrier protein Aralar1 [Folsomia candida]|uniref:Calcium-binding mitochondrial carrier protein Aralar1 n=1 Tax=Folsomia candida TaxID=158441 RepID=A0A226E442_FOLCA|nr:Calcium-binding mitochondrial carrier protein Aralar1 [Folsomia candida]
MDFHEEYAAEAFRRFDSNRTGFISVDDFCRIMITIRSHLLTRHVKGLLKDIVKKVTNDEQVSFPFFIAFNTILANVELAKKVYLLATKGIRDREISIQEFQAASNMMSQITPLQSQILFTLSTLIHDSPTMIYSDFEKLAPEQYYRKVQKRIVDIKAVENPEDRNAFIELLESGYRFAIGIMAGAIGAIVVYPMDLVKTRMQLNRPSSLYEGRLYTGTRDCIQKVAQHEGIYGFYRGITPQVVGVALGKAIKLSMNDWIRDKFMNRKGVVPFHSEIFAGAAAGFFNVFFINPLEAIKIRVQVASQINHNERLKSITAIRNLGVSGLYKGFLACCLRDVPFCAIFFPCYAHMKVRLQDDDGYNTATSLLMAGILSSLPGAGISMPFDKMKTRLQAEPLPGQSKYAGIGDVMRKIYTEEGLRAFWQGTRLIKPSSQFGVTLLVYEVLQRLFYVDFAGTRPTGSEQTVLVTGLEQVKSTNPDHIGGFALALPIVSGLESKFGLVFPKFKHEIFELPSKTKNTT